MARGWEGELVRLVPLEKARHLDNALRMLEALGYREAGRVPERYWKRGAYRDQVILILQRESG